jgi:hypothetical protein
MAFGTRVVAFEPSGKIFSGLSERDSLGVPTTRAARGSRRGQCTRRARRVHLSRPARAGAPRGDARRAVTYDARRLRERRFRGRGAFPTRTLAKPPAPLGTARARPRRTPAHDRCASSRAPPRSWPPRPPRRWRSAPRLRPLPWRIFSAPKRRSPRSFARRRRRLWRRSASATDARPSAWWTRSWLCRARTK